MKKRLEIKTEFVTYIEALTETAAPNDDYDEHVHHDELEIYSFVEGELYFSFEGDRIKVNDGDVIIISSGSLHRTVIRTPCRYFRKRLLIKNNFFASMPTGALELQNRLTQKGIIVFNREKLADSSLDGVLAEIENSIKKRTAYDDFCAMTALASFLIEAERAGGEREKRRTLFGHRAEDIVRYIDKNISSPLDYNSIASEFHISTKNLYKIFKSETGFTLSKYIRIRRIIKAKTLLNSGASPSQAAEKAGFSDYSVFYRCFTEELGIPPSKYAAKQKN
ncbi:MAG: helix-turn-helix domain-containing protein [Ruminococcaceae bacterium]|nr:helix-turn-helix domain-containing protein [Oscillospiraceae bacterium]